MWDSELFRWREIHAISWAVIFTNHAHLLHDVVLIWFYGFCLLRPNHVLTHLQFCRFYFSQLHTLMLQGLWSCWIASQVDRAQDATLVTVSHSITPSAKAWCFLNKSGILQAVMWHQSCKRKDCLDDVQPKKTLTGLPSRTSSDVSSGSSACARRANAECHCLPAQSLATRTPSGRWSPIQVVEISSIQRIDYVYIFFCPIYVDQEIKLTNYDLKIYLEVESSPATSETKEASIRFVKTIVLHYPRWRYVGRV